MQPPLLVATPRSPMVRFATANANRDGSTGTYATLFTAGPKGAFFKGIRFAAEGTTTAGFVRWFSQDAGAGNVEMRKEVTVPAITPAVGVTPAWSDADNPAEGIMLSAGSVVKVNTQIAETFSAALVGGGDF